LDARVRCLVRAGEGDLISRFSVTTAGNSELGTRDVELSATRGGSRMETEVLSAKEVVSRFDALGDVGRERRLAYFVVSVLAHVHELSS